ncbi:hypothetical protein B484DRAFT_288953, partial [Ochromonadaceae sp. CCMP2298]
MSCALALLLAALLGSDAFRQLLPSTSIPISSVSSPSTLSTTLTLWRGEGEDPEEVRALLPQLPRKRLQQLAKLNGVNGTLKSAEMLRLLLAKGGELVVQSKSYGNDEPESASESQPSSASVETSLEGQSKGRESQEPKGQSQSEAKSQDKGPETKDQRLARVLASQGSSWEEVLGLQVMFLGG